MAAPSFDAANQNARQMIEDGRQIFRFDTFGDEAFWGDTLRLHQAIEGAKFGGVGRGVSPRAALQAGLKVDLDMLPAALIEALKQGKVDLDDPATTLALLKLNAVVGVTGLFDSQGGLWSHEKGGFYHDGRFATLEDVIEHDNQFLGLGLTTRDKSDLVAYLRSL